MATYLTTSFPGEEPTARLLASTPRGHLAILTCLGPADSAFLAELRSATAPAPRNPFLSVLLELGTRGGQLWAVERAEGVHTLDLVLKRAAALGQPLHDALCARVAFRILEAISCLERPHGRLTPLNVVLLASGEIQVLGAQYAAHLPHRPADLAYEEADGVDLAASDVFGAGQIARALALRRPPRPGEKGPAALEALLPAALDAQPGPEVERAAASELAAYAACLGLPPTDSTRVPLELSTVAAAQEQAAELEQPDPTNSEGDSGHLGPSMDSEGHINRGTDRKPTWPVSRPRAAAPEAIELDPASAMHAFGPAHEPAPEPPPPAEKRRYARKLAMGVLSLAVLAAIGIGLLALGASSLRAQLPSWLHLASAKPGVYGKAMVRIESEPSGAAVIVGSEEIGLTPYLADNDFPEGANAFTLQLKGYQTYRGSIPGGRDFEVRAALRRR